jgi:predicted DNA-binding transcriptional regulator AlpA
LHPNNRVRMRAVEAARYLNVSRSTLAKWRMNGNGPDYHRCGPRIVYYFEDEIEAWLSKCDSQLAAERNAHAEGRR